MKSYLFFLSIMIIPGLAGVLKAENVLPPPQLIVKFVSGSEADQAAQNAMLSGQLENQTLLNVADSLSKQVGIPLRIQQITSGQEVVLELDTDRIIPELIKQLRQRADIEYVQSNTLMQPFAN